MVGNIVLENSITGQKQFIVGFENHTGKTFLTDKASPFASVIKGYGNNGEDGSEGINYKNLVGTYLHGPLLPKIRILQITLFKLWYSGVASEQIGSILWTTP